MTGAALHPRLPLPFALTDRRAHSQPFPDHDLVGADT
jgi:hypothetical protein